MREKGEASKRGVLTSDTSPRECPWSPVSGRWHLYLPQECWCQDGCSLHPHRKQDENTGLSPHQSPGQQMPTDIVSLHNNVISFWIRPHQGGQAAGQGDAQFACISRPAARSGGMLGSLV